MATWKTSEEISEAYRVGEERLLGHAKRGNLPCSRDVEGRRVYDEDVVAKLFRRRDGTNERGGAVLGGLRLGEVLGEAAAPRESLLVERPSRRRRATAPLPEPGEPRTKLRIA